MLVNRGLDSPTLRRAFTEGAFAGAAVLATEPLLGGERLDGPCLLAGLALGVLLGGPLSCAVSRITSRPWLVLALLLPAPLLEARDLAWALGRAVELRTPLVAVATFLAPLPLAGVTALVVRPLGGARLSAGSRTALSVAAAGLAYIVGLLVAQALPTLTSAAVTLAATLVGLALLATGRTGALGPAALASALLWLLSGIEPSYPTLRTSVFGVALGAALLTARELGAWWQRRRPPAPAAIRERAGPKGLPKWLEMCVSLALWLTAAISAERLVSAHPHTFLMRPNAVGALSAALAALNRALDVDGDGHSPFLGGHDCAPFDRARSPSAHEIPDNGQDDNCALGDARDSAAAFVQRELGVNPPPAPVRGDAVLVIVDTLRADAVGPHLAAFAAQGRRFTRAYSSASFTAQSLVGILTAQVPTAAEYRFFSPHDGQVRRLPPSLMRAARTAGYATGMAGGVRGGLFAAFFRDADVARPLTLLTPATETTATALEVWGALDPHKPRLLYVHYLALHAAQPQARYREVARAIDAELGRLFAAIGERATYVVTADHGEGFGEHGAFGHSTTLYEEAVHVPLIVRYPGVVRGEESAVTTLLGVAPTLLALLAPERLAVSRGPFFCLGQPGCGDVPAPSALEKPGTHQHALITADRQVIDDRLLEQRFELGLRGAPADGRHVTATEARARLDAWEELGFVQGARVPWFHAE